jgi:hypothetical protein
VTVLLWGNIPRKCPILRFGVGFMGAWGAQNDFINNLGIIFRAIIHKKHVERPTGLCGASAASRLLPHPSDPLRVAASLGFASRPLPVRANCMTHPHFHGVIVSRASTKTREKRICHKHPLPAVTRKTCGHCKRSEAIRLPCLFPDCFVVNDTGRRRRECARHLFLSFFSFVA